MVNSDGLYSFYAGQIIYLNKCRNTYVEVLEASNFVDANYQVPIRYQGPLKALDGLEKPVDAEALQVAINQGY